MRSELDGIGLSSSFHWFGKMLAYLLHALAGMFLHSEGHGCWQLVRRIFVYLRRFP